MPAVGVTPSRTVIAENVRDLQSWLSHGRGGLRRRRLLGVSPGTLAARHAQAIERALDLGDQPGGNAGVARRRLQLLVSEQRLNHANVRAALKQMGREAVAKRMQREGFTQPRCFRCLLEQPPELACRQRPTVTATGKQPTLFRCEAGVIRGRPRLPPFVLACT